MITGPSQHESHVVWHSGSVQRAERATQGMTVWLTGLSGSGKSTVAAELERRLVASGRPAYLLDGDNLRHGLNADLGFSAEDRAENVRRVGEVAKLLADAGVVAIVSLVSPYAADREQVRAVARRRLGCRSSRCSSTPRSRSARQRDPKGMYAKARAGEITNFTGIDDPYEAPASPAPAAAARGRRRRRAGRARRSTWSSAIADERRAMTRPPTPRPPTWPSRPASCC